MADLAVTHNMFGVHTTRVQNHQDYITVFFFTSFPNLAGLYFERQLIYARVDSKYIQF